MLLFYIIYAVLTLILAPFLTAEKGFAGFVVFFLLSMALPVVAPMLWAWLLTPGKEAAGNVRLALALHVLVACLVLIWFLSAA